MSGHTSYLFPSLNQLLALNSSNLDEELTNEQFYALVLAYNDIIDGKKREVKRNAVGSQVYALSDKEKTGLELAYKSGRNGNFSEENVIQVYSSFCNPDVSEILRENATHSQKIDNLHKIAVTKLNEKSSVGSYSYYAKVIGLTEKVNSDANKAKYVKERELLEQLGEFFGNNDALKSATAGRTNEEVQLIKQNIAKESDRALESLYAHTFMSVRCTTGFGAFQKAHEGEEQYA